MSSSTRKGKKYRSRRTSNLLGLVIMIMPVFVQVSVILHSWLGGPGGLYR